MNEDYTLQRSERRSFFCPNKVYFEIIRRTEDCMSSSEFVKRAVVEKLIRDYPDLSEEFKSYIS
jgi:hypothetical protein